MAFNRALPGLHTYLGTVGDVGSAAHVELLRVLSESGGRTVVRIPVVVLLDHVFFPGENIPLTFDHDDRGDARLAFEACMAAEPHLRGLFGVFTVYRDQSRFDLGTLAEIRQFTRCDPRGDGDDARMSLVARGCLRFTIRDETEFMRRVMDEAHFRGVAHAPTFPDVEVVVHAEPPVAARRGPPRGTFGVSGAPLTPHSAAVYGMFDAHALADRLRESPVLTLVCGEARDDGFVDDDVGTDPVAVPRDPVALSYWVAARLPIPTRVRARLLGANDAVDRLRLELKLVSSRRVRIDRDAEVRCRACELLLTSLGGLVAMSREGASGMYVNPHGIVHDMITVEGVLDGRVRLEGEPETAHSWFPGFAWTACFCARCDSHLGWRFTPAGNTTTRSDERSGDGGARDGGDETSASSFFGLSRASVVVDTERPYVSWDASDSDSDPESDDERDGDGTEGATQMLEENPAAEQLAMETNDVM